MVASQSKELSRDDQSDAVGEAMARRKRNVVMGMLILLILLAAVASMKQFVTANYQFKPKLITTSELEPFLLAMFAISLIVERFAAVASTLWVVFYISQYRHVIRKAVYAIRGSYYDNVTRQQEGEDLKNQRDLIRDARRNLILARVGEIERITVIAAFTGVLIALANIRALPPFVDPPSDRTSFPFFFFQVMDIALTAGLVAGGSRGIHTFAMAILDFLKSMQKAGSQSKSPRRERKN